MAPSRPADPQRRHAVEVAGLEGRVELFVGGLDAGHVVAHRSTRLPRRATRTASTLPRASCTRTHQAPAAAARAVTASVASSRSSTGRGPSLSPQQLAEEAFARGTHQQRLAQRRRRSPSPCSSAQLCSGLLGEAQTRVEHDSVGARTPAVDCGGEPRLQLVDNLATRRRSGSQPAGASRSLCPRQCMRTTGTPASATNGSMASSAKPPETSLTRTAPASTAARGHLGAHRVDARPHTFRRQRLDHRKRPDCSSRRGAMRSAPGRVDSPPTSMRSAPRRDLVQSLARPPDRRRGTVHRRRTSRE